MSKVSSLIPSTVASLVFLLLVAPAQSAIIIVSVDRGVRTDTGFGPSSLNSSGGVFSDTKTDSYAGPFGNFDVVTNQTSNIASLLLRAAGGGDIGASAQQGTGIFAESFFDVVFDISAPHFYGLTGTLTASMDGGQGDARLQLFRVGVGVPILDFRSLSNLNGDTGPVTTNSSGVLVADRYQLVITGKADETTVSASGFYAGSATFDNTLRLAPQTIPEPGSIAIWGLLLGAGGYAAVRRRRRRKHSI